MDSAKDDYEQDRAWGEEQAYLASLSAQGEYEDKMKDEEAKQMDKKFEDVKKILKICQLFEQPQSDSLAQPSPLKVYPTCASSGSNPPFARDQAHEQAIPAPPIPEAGQKLLDKDKY